MNTDLNVIMCILPQVIQFLVVLQLSKSFVKIRGIRGDTISGISEISGR